MCTTVLKYLNKMLQNTIFSAENLETFVKNNIELIKIQQEKLTPEKLKVQIKHDDKPSFDTFDSKAFLAEINEKSNNLDVKLQQISDFNFHLDNNSLFQDMPSTSAQCFYTFFVKA